MEPELSIVLFRRRGWQHDDYQRWSDRMLADGAVPSPSSPEEFTAYIRSEEKKWAEVVRVSGAKLE